MRLFFVCCVFLCLMSLGSAKAQVTVEVRESLNFGEIVADPAGDRITVRPGGNIRQTGASDLQGGHSNARFRILGEPNEAVSYSFISGNVSSGSGQTLVLEDFQTNRSNPFNLNARGRLNIRVGATLVIPPGFSGGNVSGDYTIIIDNQ